MSTLYALPIEGQGTARVEALSSYLIRSANLHAVSTGGLIQTICERSKNCVPTKAVLAGPISAITRPNATTEGFVAALSTASGRIVGELEGMTLLAMSDALHRGVQTYAKHLRWCPVCMNEQTRAGNPGYYHLAWQISLLTTCSIHGVKLRDRCPRCHGTQDGYGQRRDLAHCTQCDGRLDTVFRTDLTREVPLQEIYTLVEHIAQHPGLRYPPSGVARIVGKLLDEAWSIHEEASLYRILQRDDCIRFADPCQPITLLSALRLAHRLQVPVTNLLLGDIRGLSHSILSAATEDLPDPLKAARRRLIDHEHVVSAANVLAENSSASPSPPSLRAVARELCVSTGALWYRCPSAAQSIVDCYCVARKNRLKTVRHRAKREVSRAIKTWRRSENGPASRKGLLRLLRAATSLPKHVLIEEIGRQFSSTYTEHGEISP